MRIRAYLTQIPGIVETPYPPTFAILSKTYDVLRELPSGEGVAHAYTVLINADNEAEVRRALADSGQCLAIEDHPEEVEEHWEACAGCCNAVTRYVRCSDCGRPVCDECTVNGRDGSHCPSCAADHSEYCEDEEVLYD